MFRRRAIVVLVLMVSWMCPDRGKGASPQSPDHVKVVAVTARAADTVTIDALIRAMYEVISGPKGAPRQWSRDRTLYWPGTRFMWTERDEAGAPRLIDVDHQGAVDLLNKEMVDEGYFSREIHRVTQVFGSVGHVFSTYESRHALDGPVVGRGINNLQLVYDGHRWWITALSFEEESPGLPIPPEFLPKNAKSNP